MRLIVERERQRMAFVSATYWDLLASFATFGGESFEAELISVDGRQIPASRDLTSHGPPEGPATAAIGSGRGAAIA